MKHQLLNFFNSLQEFSEFSAEELLIFLAALTVKQYPDGYCFIKEGYRGDTLFILIEGSVNVSRQIGENGKSGYVKHLNPGALFGLVSLIDYGKRAASCDAIGAVTVGSLPRSAFDLLCNNNATLGQKFQFLIAKQLANDTRVYNQALNGMLNSGDHAKFYGALMAASYEYRGIERRRSDRRFLQERRNNTVLPN